jgi:hypothetical protein
LTSRVAPSGNRRLKRLHRIADKIADKAISDRNHQFSALHTLERIKVRQQRFLLALLVFQIGP